MRRLALAFVAVALAGCSPAGDPGDVPDGGLVVAARRDPSGLPIVPDPLPDLPDLGGR